MMLYTNYLYNLKIMNLIKSTYRTFSGIREIIEVPKSKGTKWVIYQDDKPTFFVDLYDLSIESNSMMNSLVLCARRTIEDVIKLVNERNNINLSIPKISSLLFKIKLKSEIIEIDLVALPDKWLAYSL
jgi:hypothetical protein